MRQAHMQSALEDTSRSPSPEPITHAEEQRALRSETIAAFQTAVDEDDEEDGLLVPREKTLDEREREEEEYRDFLQREVGVDLKDIITVDPSSIREPTPEPESSEENSDEEPAAGESKSKSRKRKERKQKLKAKTQPKKETEQEFLMKSVLTSTLRTRTDALQLHPRSSMDRQNGGQGTYL